MFFLRDCPLAVYVPVRLHRNHAVEAFRAAGLSLQIFSFKCSYVLLYVLKAVLLCLKIQFISNWEYFV